MEKQKLFCPRCELAKTKIQHSIGNAPSSVTSSINASCPPRVALLGIPGPPLLTSSCPSSHTSPATGQRKAQEVENSAGSHLVRSRNRGAAFCFKISNEVDCNNSKGPCLGTGVHSLSDTAKFYSKEFRVYPSHLLHGENTRRCCHSNLV